jgi:hypothetical protein
LILDWKQVNRKRPLATSFSRLSAARSSQ